MQIRFVMLVIVALALGGALARGQANEPITRAWLRGGPWSARLKVVAGNELTAIALVGGGLLLLGQFRRQEPTPLWGLGRWVWSISGLFAAFNLSTTVLVLLVTEYRRVGVCPPREILLRVLHSTCTSQFLSEFAWAIVAIALTRRLSGIQQSRNLDMWESSGIVFGILVVASTVLVKLLQALSF